METAFHAKKITVVGLARSGVGAANLLVSLGAKVTVTDMKEPSQLDSFRNALSPAVSLVLGNHPAELFESSDLIVISPGVSLETEPLARARNKGVQIIGELELAAQALQEGVIATVPEFLAVTGTNGKSTTTALLDAMLKNSGIGTILGGNIGNSIAAEVVDMIAKNSKTPNLRYIVAELSSFQLETIETFRPKGATILNITPDHLDRYHGMGAYISAKCRVVLNQAATDYLVLNADDPYTSELEGIIGQQARRPQVFYFSRKTSVEGIYYTKGKIRFNISQDKLQRIDSSLVPPEPSFTLDPKSFIIRGVHNVENAMAAALMAYLSGCNFEGIKTALAKFPGLEHRLEFVRELNGVKYINDSKGTNVGAVLKSLEGFTEPVILIAGGRDKDSDFSLLRPLIKEKVKRLVLVGDAAEKIGEAVCDVTECDFAGFDFRSAIVKAKEAAISGDVVLLSPGCASFDMFRDFEDRGRQFKGMVMGL